MITAKDVNARVEDHDCCFSCAKFLCTRAEDSIDEKEGWECTVDYNLIWVPFVEYPIFPAFLVCDKFKKIDGFGE